MELNNEQKKAAFCTDNAVVSAGAGSGKTMVLANRFAWLLTEKGYKIDEILTLTFTKKAAAQMFKRIYSLVYVIAEKESGIKAERARAALDDFIQARIQTLDSYASSIVRKCAQRYGISPDFQIDQERCLALALEVSYPFFIAHRHHPAIERLYSDYRPDSIVRDIFADILINHSQIDRNDDFTTSIKKQFGIICAEWKSHCEKIKTLLEEMERHIFENNSLLPALVPVMEKYKNEKTEIPDSSCIRKYFDQLLNTPVELCIEKAEADPLQKTIVVFLYFLNSIGSMNLRAGKRSDNPVKENIKQIRTLLDTLLSLAISCLQAGFNISFTSLTSELQGVYLNRKRVEGVLTFRDVANLSRTILVEQTDIRQSEKESFKAIMIDEFQDNNEMQKELLFLLAEKQEIINSGIPPACDLCPGKLFFVGDEKQSIYLFRGADVSVFRKLKEELNTSDLPLKINYRSAPKLITAFNSIFGGSGFDSAAPSVFAPSQSLPLFEASYTPLEAGSNVDGSLSVCVLNKKNQTDEDDEDRLSADENEARFIAEKIKELLEQKKYQGNDIAVLFRTRSAQYLFEKHLRLLDIPYTCEDINNLFYGGPINDIMSVLRLAAHPHDSAAYAEMLRSPFAGLSLPGTALCLSIYSEKKTSPFDDEPLAILEEDDKKKYLHGQKIYKKICEKAASENINTLVSELWYNEGYRCETEWNPQTNVYNELYDYLFHLAAKADAENRGLASFTDSMCSFRDSGGRLSEIEIPLERAGAVHLITIHKSKGLEFPVVFLCGCGKRSRTDNSGAAFFSDETGVVFNLPVPYACRQISGKRNNFFWQRSSDETKQKRTAELRRLLYVGMTRAVKELYITGSLDIKHSDEIGDFSAALRQYVEEKLTDNENHITGDSIINNDTFFGLLLPSIAYHVPTPFFTLEEIPAYNEEYIKNQEIKTSRFSNDQKGLNEFIKNAERFYQTAEEIKTPVLYDNHRSPVSLRDREDKSFADKNYKTNGEYSGENSGDVFKKVDSLLARYSQTGDDNDERINSASFGTIAHVCVEAHLNRENPIIPANIAGFLSPQEADSLLEAGKELAVRFINSPLGKIAESAELRENEFSFRSLIKNSEGKEIFINGTVDLFFEDKNCVHIVDFKTDSHETPGEHIAQMTCYYQAVSSLFGLPEKKECRAWLYYLRSGHAVEMTEKVKQFDIEAAAFSENQVK